VSSYSAGQPNTKPYITEVLAGHFPISNYISITGTRNVNTTTPSVVGNCATIVLPFPYFTTPQKVYFASTSNSDTSTGIGARALVTTGLNENYETVSELIFLNGQTPVASVNNYIRPIDFTLLFFGTNVTTQGDPSAVGTVRMGYGTFTAGVPQYVFNCVIIGDTTSRTAVFTVPAGYTAFWYSMATSVQPKPNDIAVLFSVKFRLFGYQAWYSTVEYCLSDSTVYEPIVLPEKTDIQVRVRNDGNSTQEATVSLILELRKNVTI